MGLQPHAAIGDGSTHGGKLHGSKHVICLANSRLGGNAVGPLHTVVFQIFLLVGHNTFGFVQFYTGAGSKSKIFGVGHQTVNAQVISCIAEECIAGYCQRTIHTAGSTASASTVQMQVGQLVISRTINRRGSTDYIFLQSRQGHYRFEYRTGGEHAV